MKNQSFYKNFVIKDDLLGKSRSSNIYTGYAFTLPKSCNFADGAFVRVLADAGDPETLPIKGTYFEGGHPCLVVIGDVPTAYVPCFYTLFPDVTSVSYYGTKGKGSTAYLT